MHHKKFLIVAIFSVSVLFYNLVLSDESYQSIKEIQFDQPQREAVNNAGKNTIFEQLIAALHLNPLDKFSTREFTVLEQMTMNQFLSSIEPGIMLVENIVE